MWITPTVKFPCLHDNISIASPHHIPNNEAGKCRLLAWAMQWLSATGSWSCYLKRFLVSLFDASHFDQI
ncbi:hypothetical protein I7I48_07731 [Histoplasma ohiense]|nr:hypothetical protein I7I48_07731 [Histoplasma ohiense (nom. inval.)]